MHRHHIHLVKRAGAGWAFAHTIADSIVDAFVAEQVTASLQSCVFEVVAADGTQSKCLYQVSFAAILPPIQ
jgi:hypothetical protein